MFRLDSSAVRLSKIRALGNLDFDRLGALTVYEPSKQMSAQISLVEVVRLINTSAISITPKLIMLANLCIYDEVL